MILYASHETDKNTLINAEFNIHLTLCLANSTAIAIVAFSIAAFVMPINKETEM